MRDLKPLVLVIDDEPQMRKFLRVALEGSGYRVLEAESAREGLRRASAQPPDLVLLDLGLPDADGAEVTERLRAWSDVPIVVVSARAEQETKVRALDNGADDYLTKPFGAAELLARARLALRHAARTKEGIPAVVLIGDGLRVDLVRRVVTLDAKEIHLTATEYKLLATFVKNAGMVMTHRQLLEKVWGPDHVEQTEYLRVYMMQLRHKLERDPAHPKHLLTESGVGYRLKG